MNYKLYIENWLKSFLHILFPVSCPICGNLGEVACAECLDSLRFNRNVKCFGCGLEYPCAVHYGGAWVYYYARHEGIARELVLSLKYSGQESLGRAMGGCIGRALLRDNEKLISSYDKESAILVPIPLHINSKRRFNQSKAIAVGIARVLGLKVFESLHWSSDIETQTEKSRKERLALADDAFKADIKKISGKKVILVDDVITTGTTLRRALFACTEAGAECKGVIAWTRT